MVSGPKREKLTQYIGEEVPRAQVKNRSKPLFSDDPRYVSRDKSSTPKIT